MVSRVIDAPVELVWRTFVEPGRRRAWASDVESVSLTVVEPGRRCAVRLVGATSSHHREYTFASVEVGPRRGATVVTAIDEPSGRLGARLLDLMAGGFATRTVEGAVRDELDALAGACTTRVITASAA
jgi:uncharacterized protein YndB with AHSA1/START domain